MTYFLLSVTLLMNLAMPQLEWEDSSQVTNMCISIEPEEGEKKSLTSPRTQKISIWELRIDHIKTQNRVGKCYKTDPQNKGVNVYFQC